MTPLFNVGSYVEETRFGATQHDSYHNIAGRGQSRRLKQGQIIKLTPRFFVSGFDALIQWTDGTKDCRVADQYHLNLLPAPHLKKRLLAGKFDCLYHMTHIQNLSSILASGILSNAEIKRRRVSIADISDSSVQARRDEIEPIYDRSIHEYVPFYLNPKNPMLYRRKEMQNEIVIIAVSTSVLSSNCHVFTDGNAAANATLFSDDESVINNSKDVLCAQYWTDYDDGKRRRCAEVLVYPSVGVKYIERIACNNEATRARVASITNIQSTIEKGLYF